MARKHKFTLSLAVALVLMLALGAVAVAAQRSGLMQRWFPGQQPPEQTEALLVRPGDRVEWNGVVLALDEHIKGGNILTIGWSVTNGGDAELALVGGAPQLEGCDNTGSGGFAARWWQMEGLEPLAAGARAEAHASYKMPEGREGPVGVPLRVDLYQPGQTPDAAQPLHSLALEAVIEPREAGAQPGSSRPRVFEFDGYTLTVDRLAFSGAATVLEYTLETKRPAEVWKPSKQDLIDGKTGETDPLLQREYVLLDSEGNRLMADAEPLGSYDGPEVEQLPDGRARLRCTLEWSPLARVPEEVVLMPIDGSARMMRYIEQGMDHEQALQACYLPGEAVTIRLN